MALSLIIQLIFDKSMGSFRSQPDLKKHTHNKDGHGTLTYAVSHMCGTSGFIQAGVSTWRTRTSAIHPLDTQRIRCSAYSTATEVRQV